MINYTVNTKELVVTKQLKTLDLSMFHFNSYGIVAADNPDNESEIKVFPTEKLYLEDGDQNVKEGTLDKDETYKPDSLKHRYRQLKVLPGDIEPRSIIKEEVMPLDKTKYLYANWCGINSPNRMTPPNVCKGEKVILYRYGNSDKYFWDTLGFELNLRKEDHVVHAYSDKPEIDEGNVKSGTNEDLDETYYIMMSPKTKTIKLHTTDKYSELTTYDITLKTDTGFLEILDGKQNRIILNSANNSLKTHLHGNSTKYDWELNGDDGSALLRDSSGNHIIMDSNSGAIDMKSKTLNLQANKINMKATNVTITATLTNWKGGFIKHDGLSIDKLHVHTGNLGYSTSPPIN